MEIILIKEVDNLGHPGEVKNVAAGYARNYLLPKNLAILATAEAKKSLKTHRNRPSQLALAQKSLAIIKRKENFTLNFTKKANEQGRLFAAINKKEILEKLNREFKLNLTEKNIFLEQPIKQIGRQSLKIKIADDETTLLIDVKTKPNE